MIEKRLTITNPLGLHLRPAGKLCKKAMEYESTVMIHFRNKEFNAKSLLGILGACVQQNDEIVLVCDGKDEETAAKEIAAYIECGMDDD